MANQDEEVIATEPTREELLTSIRQLVNPKTGETFTEFDAQRFLRAAMKRRAKAARRLAAWRASRKERN